MKCERKKKYQRIHLRVFGLRKWGKEILIALTDGREAGLEDKERQEWFWINLRCL